MPAPCCPESFAGSMRPCPRCPKWICHHCGVNAGGKLVCRDCVNKPDPVSSEAEVPLMEFVNLAMVPAALAGGVGGGLLGGLAWGGIASVLGTPLGIFGILAGIGARLGVRAALPYRAGCAWPAVSSVAVLPGYAFGRYLTAYLVARSAGGVGFFDAAVRSTLWNIVTQGFGLLELCWVGLAIVAATVRFRRGR